MEDKEPYYKTVPKVIISLEEYNYLKEIEAVYTRIEESKSYSVKYNDCTTTTYDNNSL